MMSEKQFERFIINLKLLNAKERDHLMRYAYLGATGTNDKTESYLSDEFIENLKPHLIELGLSENSKCLFAGMDYHLDWLYVALKFAIEKPTFVIADKSNLKIKFPMETAQKSNIFREISGSQEDIDLIAVFKSEVDSEPKKYAILFIEAKGSANFDGVQLARKLIRLDHILKISGALSLINYRLILAAPSLDIKFDDCSEFALSLLENKLDKSFKFNLVKALSPKNHISRVGEGLYYLKTPFPQTFAIKRLKDSKEGSFTKWKFSERKGGLKKNDP